MAAISMANYIIDLKNSIVYVDSLYEAKKKGRRSIANILKEKYFGDSEPVRFTSYFKKRVQTDSYTCGAWLIAGFVGYSLDLSAENYILSREKVFDLLMVLNENLDLVKKNLCF